MIYEKLVMRNLNFVMKKNHKLIYLRFKIMV